MAGGARTLSGSSHARVLWQHEPTLRLAVLARVGVQGWR